MRLSHRCLIAVTFVLAGCAGGDSVSPAGPGPKTTPLPEPPDEPPLVDTEGDSVVSADASSIVFGYDFYQGEDFDSGIWRFDLTSSSCTRISMSGSGTPPPMDHTRQSMEPAVSRDGRLVVFSSWAPNLIPGEMTSGKNIFLKSVDDLLLYWVSRAPSWNLSNPVRTDVTAFPRISGDGRFTNLISESTDGEWDVMLLDRNSGHINVYPCGGVDPTLFIRDRLLQETIHVGGVKPRRAEISPDGREVFFISQNQGFVYRTQSRQVRRII